MALEVQRVAEHWSSIELEIVRDGDWAAATEATYWNTHARLWCREVGTEPYPLVGHPDLRPGVFRLARVPISEPEMVIDYGLRSWMRPRPESTAEQVELTASGNPAATFRGLLDTSNLAAVHIAADPESTLRYAWFLIVGPNPADATGPRYEPAKGLVIDGLKPGKYSTYWAESSSELRRLREAELPLEVVHLKAGLQRVFVPSD
jgi:hypothetical protein